jgi:hypothetical protein
MTSHSNGSSEAKEKEKKEKMNQASWEKKEKKRNKGIRERINQFHGPGLSLPNLPQPAGKKKKKKR